MRKGPDRACIRLASQAHLRMLGPESVCCVPGRGGAGAVVQAFGGELVSPLGAVLSCWHVCVEQLDV